MSHPGRAVAEPGGAEKGSHPPRHSKGAGRRAENQNRVAWVPEGADARLVTHRVGQLWPKSRKTI